MKKKIISIIFCTLLISVVTSNAIYVKNTDNTNSILLLVRIETADGQINIPKDMEIIGYSPGNWIDIIIPDFRLQELSDMDINYEVIIKDLIKYDNLVRGQYHTLPEIETILQDIADDHPSITDLYSIGTTYEGRDIWCLEITDNPGVDEGEPGVFFMGLHHAREWPTVEICLNICEELTSGYTSLVNSNRIFVVTCVNPDGYVYCHDQGHDWRKNRRPIPGGIGIDLNRNYGGSSNGDPWGAWGSVGTGSITHHPDNEVYCGPAPFSEAESQTIRDMFLQNDIHAAISWHTHGELVLWPWAYTKTSQAPDNDYLSQVGQDMAEAITGQSGSGHYTPKQGSFLYPTTGDTTDWVYGYSHYVIGRPAFCYTIEACTSFHPQEGVLDQVVAENFDAALIILEEAENIRDTIVPRVMPPIIDEMEEPDIDGDYTVSWEEKNPDADPSKFQLDELIGPSIYTDDAESSTDFWALDGFSKSTARSHSSSHSYKSGPGNEKVYSMVSADPIPVTEGMKLEFWTWYNIEDDYDYAMIEVSRDGRSYDYFDGFTGTSTDWEHKQYNLTDYVGESIFIRLRYITDGNTLEEGIYFDDISPVVKWDSITTLSDSITTNSFDITDKQDGTFYYRVKGYNSEHGWCDFSTLEEMVVDILINDPPAEPTIDGPASGNVGEVYEYIFKTTDPDGNQVFYYIEWGDGQTTGWEGPYNSGEEVIFNHSWSSADTYIVRAQSKDIWDYESTWGELEVVIPRSKTVLNHLFHRAQRFFTFLQNIFNIFDK
jgi:carboxypeptidase T